MKKIKKAILLVIVLGLMTGCGTAKLSDGKESVVTFKDNAGISAETLYEKLKDKHGVEVLVNLMDTELLSKEYSKTDSEQDYVDNMFNSYKKQWGDNFKSYMAYYFGVSTEDELKEYIRLNYRRNAWTEDYAKKQVSKKLKACYKKIYNFLISDDESSDGVKACLGEIEKLKSSIFNKYKEDLKIKDYQEFLAKIAITESEFKSKYHEREYLSNMINNFYKNNEEEMNIGRGR